MSLATDLTVDPSLFDRSSTAAELTLLHDDAMRQINLVDLVVDVIFMVDILINLRTGYMDRGLFVSDSALMAKRYCRTWLAIDVVSSIPLSLVQVGSADSVGGVNRLLRMLKLSKLFRILKVSLAPPSTC